RRRNRSLCIRDFSSIFRPHRLFLLLTIRITRLERLRPIQCGKLEKLCDSPFPFFLVLLLGRVWNAAHRIPVPPHSRSVFPFASSSPERVVNELTATACKTWVCPSPLPPNRHMPLFFPLQMP
ncbi:unnamed protein product, partial [Ectocarpus sp. 12 AP-2014]